MPTVLLSTPAGFAADDLRAAAEAAGFAVAGHALGSTPPVDFGPVAAAVVDVVEKADAAAAQTRRWRVELGDQFVPLIWVIPDPDPALAARGLDAGADAVLSRPVDPAAFAAQLRSAARARSVADRVAAKAAEARLLGDQMRKAYAQLDREQEMARRVHRTFLPRSLPEVGPVRFHVAHRPRSKTGGDFYDVQRIGEHRVGFLVGDVLGHGSAAGSLLGVFAARAVGWGEPGRLLPPEELLVGVNRELIGLGLDDPPLVALLAGTLDVRTGAVAVARAGLPPPVYVPADGEPEAWAVPGPFLGTADTQYTPRTGTLRPGDRLVVGTDGTRPDGMAATGGPDPLREAAARHRGLAGPAFADALARDLLPQLWHPDDFTLMVVEMTSA
jgi:hypothetical protein